MTENIVQIGCHQVTSTERIPIHTELYPIHNRIEKDKGNRLIT